ncbi:MAG: DUF697 domain-containing protein [Synergistaceae bacterium]|nr:DUF697 domain-containing protein [Synergistaceae bacterium]
MTDEQSTKCHAIIHTATVAAAAVGAGLAQLPFADTIPITAAQITMITSLGVVFDIPLDEAAAKAFRRGLMGALGGKAIAKQIPQLLGKRLVGMIPFFGNAVNAATAVAITEKLGWAAAEKFDREARQKIKA